MSDSTTRPILAASAACFRGGKLLLARRANPPQLWTLPGGRVEAGEVAADAARRELKEETGVDADILGFAGFREMVMRGANGKVERHYVILSFAARWRAGEAQTGAEISAIEWIESEAVARYETTEGLEEIVAAARRIAEG
jgi:ADP-ribose pyrophosphatase YjhB (NUDIX family)